MKSRKSSKPKIAASSSAAKPAKLGTPPSAEPSKGTSSRMRDVTDQYEGQAFQIIGAKKP